MAYDFRVNKRPIMDFPSSLEPESSEPLYLQISRSLRERIERGILAPGSKLPSAVEMAKSLSVARLTVLHAYNDLSSHGYVEARGGSGTYVTERVHERNALFQRIEKRSIANHPVHLSAYGLRLQDGEYSKAHSSESNKFNYGAPASDMLPSHAWKLLLLQQCRELTVRDLEATPETFGLFGCRSAIAEFLNRSKGLNCSPEQVIVFAGSQQPLNYLARILVDPGDELAMENPSYSSSLNDFAWQEARIHSISVDEDGLIVKELNDLKDIKLVYTTPSYQDPTGAVMSQTRRKELLIWAKINGVLIIEDGWDSDFNFAPPALPALQGMSEDSNVFYIYSFWKLLYPLSTVSVLVVPPQFIKVFETAKELTEKQFSILEQRTLARFIEEGHLARYIKKAKTIYSARRTALLELLLKHLPGLLTIPKQSAGLHLCVRFDSSFSHNDVLKFAKASGFPLIATTAYYRQNPRENEFIVPFALANEEKMRAQVAAFAQYFSR